MRKKDEMSRVETQKKLMGEIAMQRTNELRRQKANGVIVSTTNECDLKAKQLLHETTKYGIIVSFTKSTLCFDEQIRRAYSVNTKQPTYGRCKTIMQTQPQGDKRTSNEHEFRQSKFKAQTKAYGAGQQAPRSLRYKSNCKRKKHTAAAGAAAAGAAALAAPAEAAGAEPAFSSYSMLMAKRRAEGSNSMWLCFC